MSDKDLKYKNKYLKYKNKYLNLKNQTGGIFFTKFIPASLLNFFIKDTTLNYDRIDDTEFLQIAELMKINKTVTTLNITNSILSDDVYLKLEEALRQNKTLKTLNLTNSITRQQLNYLIKGLQNNTTLQTLNLTDNFLSDEGAVNVIKLLKQNKIKIIIDNTQIFNKIDKNNNNIINANYKDQIDTLNRLNFEYFINTIDNKTLDEITHFLNQYTTLNITNIKISDIGFTKLCDALKTNTTLTTLHIGNNNINDIDLMIVNLFNALKQNKTLKTLHLNITELTDNDAERIKELLEFNTTLITLTFSSNQFTNEGKKYFNKLQKRMTITFDNNI